jgi:hypothetical protein
MNILIDSVRAVDPILIEELVSLQETNIYLSISVKDTLRILHEISPELLIIDKVNLKHSLLSNVRDLFPKLEIYLYDKISKKRGVCRLVRFSKRNEAVLPLQHEGLKAFERLCHPHLKTDDYEMNTNYSPTKGRLR